MTDKKYYDLDRLSFSKLKILWEDPALYRYHKDIPYKQTDEMLFGNAFHTYVLQNDLFDKKYFICDKITRKGKAWEEKLLIANGRDIIFKDQMTQIVEMSKSLYLNIDAIFPNPCSKIEQIILWNKSNIDLKSKLDVVDTECKFILDLKTTACIDTK
jgi:hypothetical protein